MALTNCWECGESVSEYAETCPHCGVKSPGIKPPDPPADQATDPDDGTTLTPDPPADQAPHLDDGSTFTPDPPSKKRGCLKLATRVALVILALVGLFIIASMALSLYYTNITPSTPPSPTPTWTGWKASAKEIPYDDLFRYAEEHEGKRVYYQGTVIQTLQQNDVAQLRVNVATPDSDLFDLNLVFLRYNDPPVRVLEGDQVEFVGRMNGTITYESIMGAQITIPDLTVLSLIINSE